MADSTPVAPPAGSSTSAFEALFIERICKNDPLSAMAAHAGAFLLAAAPLQALFDDCNQAQYTRKITFPLLVSLLGEVVIGTRPSVRTAYEHRKELLGATLAAVYQKLQHVEAAVSQGGSGSCVATCFSNFLVRARMMGAPAGIVQSR